MLKSAGKSRFSNARRSAFTLVELLVVISIIGVLVGVLLVGLTRALNSAKKAASEQSTSALAQAVVQFRSEFGFLPPLVHDGLVISGGDPNYQPLANLGSSQEDGPVIDIGIGNANPDIVLVWSEGFDRNFFRRRTGNPGDAIELPSGGGEWDDVGVWDDRRYSKFSLAYYIGGVLGKTIDGREGAGSARPLEDGSFEGVGYPVGSSRDRYDPTMDVDRRGVRIRVGYGHIDEYVEHGQPAPGTLTPDDFNTALVDSFGNAYRYYRWEHGRFVPGAGFVVENALDMNIPPILIDPVLYTKIRNSVTEAIKVDLTSGNTKLRNARFAVVGAGPDGLFGVEAIETIADALGVPVPTTSDEMGKLRKRVWDDNSVEVGK
ncbi:MAG: type II secretion system protein [Phycisphaerales bacterium]|nr:type II secretion system protein [Phycisphaerales bacterium]